MPPKTRKRAREVEEEELDGKTCFEKIRSFKTIAEFYDEVPEEDYSRYVTKAIKSQRSNKIKCIECDKTFASSSGFIQHIRKCQETEKEEDEWAGSTFAQFKLVPTIWLKVGEDRKNDVVGMICKSKKYRCFGANCSTTCPTAERLIEHLNKCIVPSYASFEKDLEGIRRLDSRLRAKVVRQGFEASESGRIQCVECDKTFKNVTGILYHLERCNVDRMLIKWSCEMCDFVGQNHEKESHLAMCIQHIKLNDEKKASRKSRSSIPKPVADPSYVATSEASEESDGFSGDEEEEEEIQTTKPRGCKPRPSKNSDTTSIKYKFRKSDIFKANNSSVNKYDQERYEKNCRKNFELWKTVELCEKLRDFETNWREVERDDNNVCHLNLNRSSVTIRNGFSRGANDSLPQDGQRIECLKSVEIDVPKRDEKIGVAYCGVPINSIKTAPNKIQGEDLICICTFANETDLVSESSLVQFWKFEHEENRISPYFLLNLPNLGTVLTMEWLRNDEKNLAAFAMSTGEILIYNIDFEPDSDNVPIVETEDRLVLRQPGSEMVKSVTPPIVRLSWSLWNGGKHLVAINAAGSVLIWDIDDDTEMPILQHRDPSWNSPPTDLAFLSETNLVISFREKLVRVVKFENNTLCTILQDSSTKSSGQRVFVDSRAFEHFFTYQTEYNGVDKPCGSGIMYYSMRQDDFKPFFTVVPLFNVHQLMVTDVAVHPSRGYLVSCGVDGRLIASSNGKVVDDVRLQSFYSASRNLLMLTRKRIEKVDEKAQPTFFEHETVCENMWLELDFNETEMHRKPQLACRDQRIESLNVVETNSDFENPTIFCGGEAGLLFVVPCSLKIK